MGTVKTEIQNLKNINPGISDHAIEYLFGSNEIYKFNIAYNYKKDEIVYNYNESRKKFELFIAKEDIPSGTDIGSDKWRPGDLDEKIHSLTSLSSSLPTIIPHGGIPAGTTFEEDAACEVLHDILYPFIQPVAKNTGDYHIVFGKAEPTTTNIPISLEYFMNSGYSGTTLSLMHGATVLNTIELNGAFTGKLNLTIPGFTPSGVVYDINCRLRYIDKDSNKSTYVDSPIKQIVYTMPVFIGIIPIKPQGSKTITANDVLLLGETRVIPNAPIKLSAPNGIKGTIVIATPQIYTGKAPFSKIKSCVDDNNMDILTELGVIDGMYLTTGTGASTASARYDVYYSHQIYSSKREELLIRFEKEPSPDASNIDTDLTIFKEV